MVGESKLMFEIGDIIKQNIGISAYYGFVSHVDNEKDEVHVEWFNWDNPVRPSKTTQHVANLIWMKVE
jgi:hypothetical protein